MSKFWSYNLNALVVAACALLLSLQVDVDGQFLYEGWKGIHWVIIALWGLCVWNLFRSMQVCVYGEDF